MQAKLNREGSASTLKRQEIRRNNINNINIMKLESFEVVVVAQTRLLQNMVAGDLILGVLVELSVVDAHHPCSPPSQFHAITLRFRYTASQKFRKSCKLIRLSELSETASQLVYSARSWGA